MKRWSFYNFKLTKSCDVWLEISIKYRFNLITLEINNNTNKTQGNFGFIKVNSLDKEFD